MTFRTPSKPVVAILRHISRIGWLHGAKAVRTTKFDCRKDVAPRLDVIDGGGRAFGWKLVKPGYIANEFAPADEIARLRRGDVLRLNGMVGPTANLYAV